MSTLLRYFCLVLIGISFFFSPMLARQSALDSLTEELTADGIARVVDSKDNGSSNVLLIIQEDHASVIGNIEIALILDRLYENNDVRLIGVEGASQALDAAWFHAFPGSVNDKAAMIAPHLVSGEISSDEFLTLIRADLVIQGLEDAEEYQRNASQRSSVGASIQYFAAFASLFMDDQERTLANITLQTKGLEDWRNYALQFDPWSQRRYQLLYVPPSRPAEMLVETVDEVIQRQHGLRLDQFQPFLAAYQQLLDERAYYQGVAQRSSTLANNAIQLLHDQILLPIVVGTAHAQRIAQVADENLYSYALIEPESLHNSNFDNSVSASLNPSALDRKMDGQSVTENEGFGALLDGELRPPPVIGEYFYQLEARRSAAIYEIANYMRNSVPSATPLGRYTPDAGLKTQLEAFGFTMSPDTVEIILNDPNQPDSPSNRALLFQFMLPRESPKAAPIIAWAKIVFDRSATSVPDSPQVLLGNLRMRQISVLNNPSPSSLKSISVSLNGLSAVGSNPSELRGQRLP